MQQNEPHFIYGTRAIIEAIEADKEIDKLLIQKDIRNELTTTLLQLARNHHVPVQKVPLEKLNKITRKNHQGAIAYLSSVVYASLDHIISSAYEKGQSPCLIILDRITDVRNVGAIARSAECAGVHGVVVPSRGSAQLGPDAMKTSAGALNYLPFCRVDNLKTSIKEIQANGIKVMACSEEGAISAFEADLTGPVALMMGSEEDGISPEYLKLADEHISLPIEGQIASLNVAVATGILAYEVLRQRKQEH